MLWLALAFTAFLASIAIGRSRRPKDAIAFARDGLARLATERGWTFHDDATRPYAIDPDRRVRLVAGDEGNDYDPGATSLVLEERADAVAFAVFPREPPDSALARWGEEVPTGDDVFDARFATLSRAPHAAVRATIDAALRAKLLRLQTPGLVVDSRGVALMLPGVPDALTLDDALSALEELASAASRRPAYR